jgi:hypothetical protein
MAINAIGNGILFPRGEGIPSAVRNNMVLWYDIKRQGATNESMAANPKLIDLSGNGHDATCYNFAWSGMSGIGGYPADTSNMNIQSNRAEWINSYTLKVTNAVHNNLVLQGTTIKGEQGQPLLISTKEVHIRVSGLTEGAIYYYKSRIK